MTRLPICHQCGQPIPEDAPNGVCPRCLLDIGLGGPEVNQTAPHTSSRYRFTAPKIEELAAIFPQLEILELIGQGGMGAVYKVRQTSLDRLAALKILPTQHEERGFSERFTREARALAKLTHPNIVMIFEFGQASGYSYFLMEYVDGVNLRDSLREGKLSPAEALAIVPQICDALQFAHEEGVVHRDIKPENVLIDRKGRVKIADFGIAKLLRTTQPNQTLTGTHQVMGTLHYMAPEQMEKPHTVDHRADIYSLGVVFYELLTGELPIGRFDPPSHKTPMTQRIDDVVMRTLEKEPSRRYQHASDVKTAVSEIAVASAVASQKPPISNVPSESLFCPFSVSDEMGTSELQGILRCDGSKLRFEVRKKSMFTGMLAQDQRDAEIALADIASIESYRFLGGRKIVIGVGTMAVTHVLPFGNVGCVKLSVRSADASAADRLVAAIQLAQHGVRWEQAVRTVQQAEPESLHPLAQLRVDLDKLRRRNAGVTLALKATSLVNFLFAILAIFFLALAMVIVPTTREAWPVGQSNKETAQVSVVEQKSSTREDEANEASIDLNVDEPSWVWGDDFQSVPSSGGVAIASIISLLAVAVLSVGFGAYQWWVARNLSCFHGWTGCVVGAIVTILPLHIAWLIGLPTGIAMLVTLSQRKVRAAFFQNDHQVTGILPAAVGPPHQVSKPVAK